MDCLCKQAAQPSRGVRSCNVLVKCGFVSSTVSTTPAPAFKHSFWGMMSGLPGWRVCKCQICMTMSSVSYRERDAKIGIRSEVEAPFRHASIRPCIHLEGLPTGCTAGIRAPCSLLPEILHTDFALRIAAANLKRRD